MAVDAAEREQGKARAAKDPGHDMRTRRHELSEDLTEGMGKEPTATSATDARGRCQVWRAGGVTRGEVLCEWVGHDERVTR